MSDRLSQLGDFLEPNSGLPQLRWPQVKEWAAAAATPDEQFELCTSASRFWLNEIRGLLGADYVVSESENFLLLGSESRISHPSFLRIVENCQLQMLSLLPEVFDFHVPGKLCYLVYYGPETYYTHIAYYDADGEFGSSAGTQIRGEWPHVAMIDTSLELYRTAVHELTHVGLSHVGLPLWIEEGFAQMAEGDVAGDHRNLDYRRVRKQKEHWRTHGLEQFWSGLSFSRPDEFQEFAYQLAEFLVRLLLEEFQPSWFGFNQRPREQLIEFLLHAKAADAGKSAALEHLQLSLGQLATKSLGSGEWEPRGDYGAESSEPAGLAKGTGGLR